jgi:hypothetical protein
VAAEQSQNELTTTIHLGLREVSNSSEKHLENSSPYFPQRIALLLLRFKALRGEKAMILIARGANKGSRFLSNR